MDPEELKSQMKTASDALQKVVQAGQSMAENIARMHPDAAIVSSYAEKMREASKKMFASKNMSHMEKLVDEMTKISQQYKNDNGERSSDH